MKSENDWEVESAFDTLVRAEEIQKDPAMMKKVEALAKKKMAALEKTGLVGRSRILKGAKAK